MPEDRFFEEGLYRYFVLREWGSRIHINALAFHTISACYLVWEQPIIRTSRSLSIKITEDKKATKND